MPNFRIKLFVVGLEERGKTSLCSAIIRKQRDKSPNIATVGVVKTDWFYRGQCLYVDFVFQPTKLFDK